MNIIRLNPRLPHFVIIGAMKSATSSLYDQLSAQPGIFMCTPKEPNFFSDSEQFIKGMSWYSNLFAPAEEASLIGEASTHYTKLPTHPETVQRIKEYLPDARFIYVMRHPVNRLISHYIHEWSTGVYKCSIDKAIDKYPELVTYGCYAMQLEPYLQTFGYSSVLPVFFDHLLKEPQAELERICRFIGYQGTPLWKYDLKPDNVSSERIRKFPGYKYFVESNLATSLRRLFIPKILRNAIKTKLRMQDRPVLNSELQTRVESEFDRDLENLGRMFGVNLNCENFKQVTSLKHLEWAEPHA